MGERLLSALAPLMMVGAPVVMELADSGDMVGHDTPPPRSARGNAPPSAPPTASGAAPTALPATAATLDIYVIDVGQGDSTLVLGPRVDNRRKTLLMDAGDMRRPGTPNGAAAVRTALTQAGVDHLDYVIVSHYDSDHMGGFVTVGPDRDSLLWSTQGSNEAQQCSPGALFPQVALIDNGPPGTDSASRREWGRCPGQILPDFPGTEHAHVQGGAHIERVLDLGAGHTARIVAGGGHVIGHDQAIERADTPNERSIAVLISSPQGFDFLVTGDLIGQEHGNEDAELEHPLGQELARRGIDIEVLRTGHHGAANASEARFLRDVQAEVAVVSVGDNGHGHPHCDTYTALAAANTQLLLQTELGTPGCEPPAPLPRFVVDGTIHFSVTGSSYRISTLGPTSPVTGAATLNFSRECTPAGCGTTQLDPAPAAAPCCRVCRTSQPCGDSCIAMTRTCTRPPGCACQGQ